MISGGNIDPLVLASILLRGLARSGRLVRLRVVLPDRPGALAEVTRVLADHEVNVVEVAHQRAFGGVPLREAEVELVLATRGAEHVTELRRALDALGYPAALPDALPPLRT